MAGKVLALAPWDRLVVDGLATETAATATSGADSFPGREQSDAAADHPSSDSAVRQVPRDPPLPPASRKPYNARGATLFRDIIWSKEQSCARA